MARLLPAHASGVAAAAVFAAPKYLHWGVIQISLANLLIIAIMVVVFGLALVLPFPADRTRRHEAGEGDDDRG